jgi:protein SCO1
MTPRVRWLITALRLGLVLAISLAGISGCSRGTSAFHAMDVSTIMPPLEFKLTGEANKPVTEKALRGKVTLLYFGYTSCPDVCPATLLKLALALQHLGNEANLVRILFVSVDPQRDSPAVLTKYVSSFGPHIMGVTGSDDALTVLTKRYRVAYRRDAPDPTGWYPVYHSSAVFAFDRDGRARLLINPSETAAQISEDLKTLIG